MRPRASVQDAPTDKRVDLERRLQAIVQMRNREARMTMIPALFATLGVRRGTHRETATNHARQSVREAVPIQDDARVHNEGEDTRGDGRTLVWSWQHRVNKSATRHLLKVRIVASFFFFGVINRQQPTQNPYVHGERSTRQTGS
jgi:hypothetical protein